MAGQTRKLTHVFLWIHDQPAGQDPAWARAGTRHGGMPDLAVTGRTRQAIDQAEMAQ